MDVDNETDRVGLTEERQSINDEMPTFTERRSNWIVGAIMCGTLVVVGTIVALTTNSSTYSPQNGAASGSNGVNTEVVSSSGASNSGFETVSVGSELHRDYGVYDAMPITVDAAVAAGWTPMSGTPTCVAGLGVQYVQSVGNNNAEKPLSLYFTDMGQLAGVGVFALGDSKTNLIKNGFWIPYGTLGGSNRYYISVSFRNANEMCSGAWSELPFGDQLIVNANGIGYHLPLTSMAAQQNGWYKGSCFAAMGTHWFKDISGSNMTFPMSAANLLPVVVMYNQQSAGANNEINAIFFTTPDRQQSLWPLNDDQWDPVPLPNIAMCENFCDEKCGFSDTDLFSTLHLFLKNYKAVTCDGGCTLHCCGGR